MRVEKERVEKERLERKRESIEGVRVDKKCD